MSQERIDIDLGKIRTVVLNLQTATQRRNHMQSLLSSLDLQCSIHHGPKCEPGFIGCALAHLGALLRYGSELPLLVLEDDVKETEHFKRRFEFPADADLVYLGCCSCGISPDLPQAVEGLLMSERIDDQYWRILSMITTHAILYVTRKGVQAVTDAVIKSLCLTTRPCDIEIAHMLPSIKAVAPQSVFFYQSADMQDNSEMAKIQERVTLINPITPVLREIIELSHPQRGILRFGIKRNSSGLNEWRIL